MKVRKIPMRMCVVTKEKLPKRELIRVVKTPEGIIVDPSGKMNGRGAYLKKDLAVFNQAQKTKVLNKVLETEVPDTVFEDLQNLIKQKRGAYYDECIRIC